MVKVITSINVALIRKQYIVLFQSVGNNYERRLLKQLQLLFDLDLKSIKYRPN